MVEHEVIL
jgi:hypothetical protein